MSRESYIFVEKYRPSTVEDCILPVRFKTQFEQYIKDGEIQNLLLSGGAGVGKTSVSKAMCNELGADILFINGSENGNIDTLRNEIRSFASSYSITRKPKIVIYDEADGISPATQNALKSFTEEFHKNCRFIFTCNHINKIIDPLKSRCLVIEFNFTKEEKSQLAKEFFKRCKEILSNENIQYEDKVLAEVVKRYFPDFRKTLNELQGFGKRGNIDVSVVSSFTDDNFNHLVSYVKDKKFNDIRKWIVENLDVEPVKIIRAFYDSCTSKVKSTSIPDLVLICNKYDYQNSFVVDKELNLVAMFTELMVTLEWN